MLERFDELTSLARIYLEDGAEGTAANKLRILADELYVYQRAKYAACAPKARNQKAVADAE